MPSGPNLIRIVRVEESRTPSFCTETCSSLNPWVPGILLTSSAGDLKNIAPVTLPLTSVSPTVALPQSSGVCPLNRWCQARS